MARGKRDLVCCFLCGRDTGSQSGVCAHCAGAPGGGERCRRHPLDTHQQAGDPMDEIHDGDRLRSDESYHGDTIRDDI